MYEGNLALEQFSIRLTFQRLRNSRADKTSVHWSCPQTRSARAG